MKNMGNAINEHLNILMQKNQKQIDNALQKVDKICKQMVNITTRVNSIEQEIRTITRTSGEFHENLKGMGNVFDGVRRQEKTCKS